MTATPLPCGKLFTRKIYTKRCRDHVRLIADSAQSQGVGHALCRSTGFTFFLVFSPASWSDTIGCVTCRGCRGCSAFGTGAELAYGFGVVSGLGGCGGTKCRDTRRSGMHIHGRASAGRVADDPVFSCWCWQPNP